MTNNKNELRTNLIIEKLQNCGYLTHSTANNLNMFDIDDLNQLIEEIHNYEILYAILASHNMLQNSTRSTLSNSDLYHLSQNLEKEHTTK